MTNSIPRDFGSHRAAGEARDLPERALKHFAPKDGSLVFTAEGGWRGKSGNWRIEAGARRDVKSTSRAILASGCLNCSAGVDEKGAEGQECLDFCAFKAPSNCMQIQDVIEVMTLPERP